jgi:hypothetical protein
MYLDFQGNTFSHISHDVCCLVSACLIFQNWVINKIKVLQYLHNYHHPSNMQLDHPLTCSGLTHLEVSLTVSSGFFCLLVCSFLLFSVIYYEAFCLYVATDFICITVVCPKVRLYLVLLQSVCLFYNLSKCILLFFVYFIITGTDA